MSLTSRRTVMARKRYKPEEIVAKLRQVDVLVSQGQGMTEAIRQIGVSEVTYYRWRQEFGGLKTEQVKRLKELEMENGRLRKGPFQGPALSRYDDGSLAKGGHETTGISWCRRWRGCCLAARCA